MGYYSKNNGNIGTFSINKSEYIFNLDKTKFGDSLYDFDIFTFTTAGVTGQNGPTLAQLRSAYSAYSWTQDSAFFDEGEFQGFQKWTVPVSGTYRFTIDGAAGGTHTYYFANSLGGTVRPLGARIVADLDLEQGEILQIIVGQRGEDSGTYYAGLETNSSEGDNAAAGGGGGTFIFYNSTDSFPIFAAGGGAGGTRNTYANSNANYSSTNGYDAQPAGYGAGGVSGNGGYTNAGGSSYWSAGGAGWLTDGTGGNQSVNNNYAPGTQGAYGGRSPRNGAIGGTRGNDGTDSGGNGGFGGGGGGYSDNTGTGGGGGFSGGGGSNSSVANGGGGGGGTYYTASATNVTVSQSPSWDHGSVTIELL